ncbi:hypothetical protein Snov_4288 [Ancylobacter novellus DSM 506]|uniref:D-isomer specific 2-hydroxyacid dehydrogenase catalytic domain-containing protein n=1 Tax=Ancylobacter novellus (strain ATCC 8093 / DSM 506 / JCM 20403 / CCM 1077 / IAM 12100 / NBRC 12443 / NCIMB 10456) TaxID=639283 RepID=D7A2M3_ANCN5|nr:hypothetical protein [Ancylobacter novellus]ADH91553.1 hypothetical protein Snov_4288 [Ancylobacter novellus DSM 506]
MLFLDRSTFLNDMSLPSFALQRGSSSRSSEVVLHQASAPEEVSAHIERADVVITNKVPVIAAALAKVRRLRFIAVVATGYDVIEREEAQDVLRQKERKARRCFANFWALEPSPHQRNVTVNVSRKIRVTYANMRLSLSKWIENIDII